MQAVLSGTWVKTNQPKSVAKAMELYKKGVMREALVL